MKKWSIFTVAYALLLAWLASRAGDNMFGPDKEGTLLIGVLGYVVLVVIFFLVKWIRNSVRR